MLYVFFLTALLQPIKTITKLHRRKFITFIMGMFMFQKIRDIKCDFEEISLIEFSLHSMKIASNSNSQRFRMYCAT